MHQLLSVLFEVGVLLNEHPMYQSNQPAEETPAVVGIGYLSNIQCCMLDIRVERFCHCRLQYYVQTLNLARRSRTTLTTNACAESLVSILLGIASARIYLWVNGI